MCTLALIGIKARTNSSGRQNGQSWRTWSPQKGHCSVKVKQDGAGGPALRPGSYGHPRSQSFQQNFSLKVGALLPGGKTRAVSSIQPSFAGTRVTSVISKGSAGNSQKSTSKANKFILS